MNVSPIVLIFLILICLAVASRLNTRPFVELHNRRCSSRLPKTFNCSSEIPVVMICDRTVRTHYVNTSCSKHVHEMSHSLSCDDTQSANDQFLDVLMFHVQMSTLVNVVSFENVTLTNIDSFVK
jgi:hypothetical protein